MSSVRYGTLEFTPVEDAWELVAEATRHSIETHDLPDVMVSNIDASLADTAAFCEHYAIGLEVSANCVIVKARRGEDITYAAVMVRANDLADINGVVRRTLEARKISFAPMDEATSLSGMEFGGINPIGLPANWRILVDSRVSALEKAIIGSGFRRSKLLVSGSLLAKLPGAQVIDLAK